MTCTPIPASSSSARSTMPASQRGITLIIVMLILVVVTILGIGGAQIALLGERSTRYDRDYLVATQAAEAALIDAELDIDGTGSRIASFSSDAKVGPGCGTSVTDRGMCQAVTDDGKPVWTTSTANFLDTSSSSSTVEFGTYTSRHFDNASDGNSNSGTKPALAPRYVIEFIPDAAPGNSQPLPTMYRITAMGFGPRQDVQVVLQTTFRKRPK